MKKKVLMIANDTTTAYIFRNELIKHLITDGCDVAVAGNLLNFKAELSAIGCRLIEIETDRNGTNPLADVKLLRNYTQLLRAENPDIVLTYNIKPNVYGGMICAREQIPYLVNITGLGKAVENPGILQKITIPLYKEGVRKASCIFFQNEENFRFFKSRKLLNKDAHIHMIPGSGVNLETHNILAYPNEREKICFLFAARILKEKGIDLYLNAAKRIHEIHPDTVFHICGKCDDPHYLERLNETALGDYLIYHGEVKNMTPYYAMAQCVVHPSYYPEGLSNVLLEASAHGRPVITTSRAGCREAVNHGETGFIIPVQNEDALVEAIERFLNIEWQKRYEMGLAARKKIEHEFDRNIVVRAYMEEIGRILS